MRLIVQREFAPAHGAEQPALGQLHRRARHRAVEEHGARAAAVLGLIHRQIGVAQQVLDGVAVFGEARDADARAHLVIAPGDVDRPLQRFDDALCNLVGRLGRRHLAQDDGEFVAAEPRHGVAFLDAGAQTLRHNGQQLIPGAVPDGVVDALEVIEVDVQQRATRRAVGRTRKLLRQPVAKQHAIRQ